MVGPRVRKRFPSRSLVAPDVIARRQPTRARGARRAWAGDTKAPLAALERDAAAWRRHAGGWCGAGAEGTADGGGGSGGGVLGQRDRHRPPAVGQGRRRWRHQRLTESTGGCEQMTNGRRSGKTTTAQLKGVPRRRRRCCCCRRLCCRMRSHFRVTVSSSSAVGALRT